MIPVVMEFFREPNIEIQANLTLVILADWLVAYVFQFGAKEVSDYVGSHTLI